MNQEKTGKFIAVCRKEKKLTQADLAEKLGISDRAVSKWERGMSMPDSSIMLELCDILGISVNELLTGEKIKMQDYDKFAEQNLLYMQKREEQKNKMILYLEVFMIVLSIISCGGLALTAKYAIESLPWKITVIVCAVVLLLGTLIICMKLEREVGWYQCAKCGHRYVPGWGSYTKAMHMGWTRYMKCPKCGQKSWQKKVFYKEEMSDED